MNTKVTTPLDTIVAMQQLLETARDRQTRINQRVDRIGELLDQLNAIHDKPEGLEDGISQAYYAFGDLDLMVGSVYFSDMDGVLQELRHLLEKADKTNE